MSTLVEHQYQEFVIPQRKEDGYVSLTKMASPFGKRINDFFRLDQTSAYLEALSTVTGIPVTGLTKAVQGGNDKNAQGTWAYPDVAIKFAAWLSPEFEVWAMQTLKVAILESSTGIPADPQIEQCWQNIHDRLLLNKLPSGYFSCFKETAELVLDSIRSGLQVDSHTVPDISIGQAWSRHWVGENLDDQYGDRTTYPHSYPDYFPQAQVNGNFEPYIYPVEALGEFRRWMDSTYLPQKFPNYLKRKEKQGAIAPTKAQALLKAVAPQALPAGRG